MRKPELLSPAGTLRNMKYAFAYGADAVYAGQPRYSLRVRNNDFTHENLQEGINIAHQLGKKFFVASNILPHNSKLGTYMKDIDPVIAMNPDAMIMSDPGLIMMVKDKYPDLPIHLSVQSNTMNWAAVKFWERAGIERIILSRELSLDEVEEIRQQCPDIELEVFVHGSLCIAYSGRCLLSGYINHRDPNQGTCTNSCRWKYDAHEAKEDDSGDVVAVQSFDPVAEKKPALGEGEPTDKIFLLQEETRPGEYMPAFEDEHGTYIMNSKDLRAIQHVHRLAAMGVDSLKIEGRTKSHYYVARTAQAYRQTIDDAVAGRPFDKGLMDVLENLANRGYTEGFYRRHVHDEYQNYETGSSVGVHQQFVGEVVEHDAAAGKLVIDVKNKFEVGDTLELMTPVGNRRFKLGELYDKKGASIEVAPGSGHRVTLPLDFATDMEYALLMRDLPNAPERG
ncbi:tRNA 5-hydroxyuridine modification protein YegQ [Marinobacterium sp. LSUCC0821]|uniref:prephenate-dependent tRNA uridine(34) hydroxylase TrhP n=1 Tax=Marinobacterium sp. LSUCC0821 TaxID=2668067 RepID=UPI001451CC64|nr:tRNA 5-hydroxyuridine modification protein YegQ [Marinobacterium sp. LSUCC0821]QJD70431.1 tRNA 5-hydroxyuridine modification protein YegQ [Marinobacterium sp. LSUCC0821]